MGTLLLTLMLFLLASCSASRKLATQTEHAAVDKTVSDVRIEQADTSSLSTSEVTATASDEQTEEVTIRREYDTTQPVDATTGKPPLKSETISHKSKTKQEKTHQADSVRIDKTVRQTVSDNTRYDTATEVKEQIQEERSRHPTWWIWLMIAGGLFAVYKTRKLWMPRN